MGEMLTTISQQPDLAAEIRRLDAAAWPAFLAYETAALRYWADLFTCFGDFQFALHGEDGEIIGLGLSIPLYWDGRVEGLPHGWNTALDQGFQDAATGRAPTTLCALSAVVAANHQGQGVSYRLVRGMKSIAAAHGFRAVIAPVRPSLKASYPLTPFTRYIHWKRPDGSPFDPWLRVHQRLKGVALGIAPRSMVVPGTVADWQTWTGMAFPESGSYIVPGALQPVRIDCRQDCGLYEEPNLWICHSP